MANIKDYIIDIEKQQEQVKEAKQKSTPKVEYTLVLENDMDFVKAWAKAKKLNLMV